MYKFITEAVLYNSYGCEIARVSLDDHSINNSLAKAIEDGSLHVSEGDTIKIESHMIKYY